MNVTHAAANGVDEPRQVSVRDRLRICKPYPIWQHLALPDAAIGLPLAVALAQHWKPPTTNHFDLGYLDEHGWHQVGSDGRLQLRRQERESAYRSATGEDEVRRTDQCLVRVFVTEPPVSAELPSVLLDTDRFVAVCKPAGLPVTGVLKHAELCVEGVLAAMGHGKLYVGHRLDLPVSGVLILGRSPKQQQRVLRACSAGHEEASSRKTYLARVAPPLEGPAVCAVPLGMHRGRAVRDDTAKGKAAQTAVQPLHVFPDGTQLVEVRPLQGRRHQIRAHLGLLGSPIANDQLYGGTGCTGEGPDNAKGSQAIKIIWLHAMRYEVPSLGLDVVAPLPAWALIGRP